MDLAELYDSKMKRLGLFLSVVLFIFCFSILRTFPESNISFKVAAIQLKISEKTYSSEFSFRKKIEGIVDKLFKNNHYDLVIFPEYTSVFIALIPYAREIRGKKDFKAAFRALKVEKTSLASIKELFLEEFGFVNTVMNDVFGGLAKKYNTFIVAGTCFARGVGKNGESILTNRAVVYGPTGQVCYTQDKVFLTDFEERVVGLTPGRLAGATGFVIKERRVALTICRDTFENIWSNKYNGYDIWLDIKANGARFDDEERKSFMEALPSRLGECNVKYGITVCLVGKFLNLFWEGESSIIERKNSKVIFLKEARVFRETEILSYDFF